ncbi:MAG: hypothetical protein RSF40_01535 [Oscillospiraceae bacterium]
MLYNGYDSLMNKVITHTDKMISVNSKERLALGYKKAKDYISFFKDRNDLTPIMKTDLETCVRYCEIIESL